MKIFINLSKDNEIVSWVAGDYPLNNKSIEIDIPENHEMLMNHACYKYINGELIKDNSLILNHAKEIKDTELNEKCNQSILSGFKYIIDNIEYHFSFDTEAQFNFQGIQMLFLSNTIDSILWTVTNLETNQYERITIDRELMSGLTMAILIHKDSNISKYRDDLSVRLKNATTVEEIESINW